MLLLACRPTGRLVRSSRPRGLDWRPGGVHLFTAFWRTRGRFRAPRPVVAALTRAFENSDSREHV